MGRSYITESLDDKNPRLELFDISQGPEHLLGSFVLERRIDGIVPSLVIEGHLSKSGEFSANISLEVSDQEAGKWKTIESSFSDKVDVTLTGARHIDKLYLRIQLDPFQPYIGRFKFGRVVLQTGESWISRLSGSPKTEETERGIGVVDKVDDYA